MSQKVVFKENPDTSLISLYDTKLDWWLPRGATHSKTVEEAMFNHDMLLECANIMASKKPHRLAKIDPYTLETLDAMVYEEYAKFHKKEIDKILFTEKRKANPENVVKAKFKKKGKRKINADDEFGNEIKVEKIPKANKPPRIPKPKVEKIPKPPREKKIKPVTLMPDGTPRKRGRPKKILV